MHLSSLLALAATGLLLAACASPSDSGGAYSKGQTRQEMSVRLGVVDSVRKVMIEGTRSGVGAAAGAAVGGVAGSEIGHGKGSTVGSILGAVAGGIAGQAIEQQVTKKAGLEITVKLDNGQIIAITQGADEDFRPGERVRILSGGGATRVSH